MAFSPQANYTDWATATRRILVPTIVDGGESHGQLGGSPTVFNLSFLYRIALTVNIKMQTHKHIRMNVLDFLFQWYLKRIQINIPMFIKTIIWLKMQ
jgi:hypothetical protein